eukprot:g17865.t1
MTDAPEYFPEDPPITETPDPRACLCKCCFPGTAVWAWQACDNPCDNIGAFFCCCLWTLICWSPPKRQKKFKPLGQEKKCCCCECHPKDCCCHFWFPLHAVYAWQGFDVMFEAILMIVGVALGVSAPLMGCYACCCWVPAPMQKQWGAPAGMVGPAVAGQGYGATK